MAVSHLGQIERVDALAGLRLLKKNRDGQRLRERKLCGGDEREV